MSEDLTNIVKTLSNKLAEAEGMDQPAVIKFEIDGVGSVLVDTSSTPPSVSAGDGEADLTVGAGSDVFQQMMSGQLDPTSAYMGGQLRVDGDMSLAMKLGQLLA